jgi:8-oxo-dGTP pyrophosphatase MutT (NUDIX family)
VLVGEGSDRVKNSSFYRPLGGGIEAGETPEEALVREMDEELGEEVRIVRALGEIENKFVYEGKPGWEQIHIIEAEFTSPDAPRLNRIEPEGWDLRWVDPDDLDKPLYPDGLAELLRQTAT